MAGIDPAARGAFPPTYRTVIETSAGIFEIAVYRAWAPHGADRFFELVQRGYYDDSRFHRVVAGKWAQFGIAGAPLVAQAWQSRPIPDDRLLQSNTRGFVAFANTGPHTRSTQVFINLGDNAAQNDGEAGFAPFGEVVMGMDVVDRLYAGYGELSGGGMRAGRQEMLFADGNRYLDTNFPRLDLLIRLRNEDLPR
jgi:homoserine O-acetyltransferase